MVHLSPLIVETQTKADPGFTPLEISCMHSKDVIRKCMQNYEGVKVKGAVQWGSLKRCWVYLGEKEEESKDQLTPLPLGEVGVCCWIVEVSAEHGFCTRMEVIGEHQGCGKKRREEELEFRETINTITIIHTFCCPALCSLGGFTLNPVWFV